MVAYHIPNSTHADMPAMAVLRTILGTGKSSRLYRALVETGMATDVYASDVESKDPSLFMVGANLQKKKKAAQAETVVLKEIARIAKESVTDAEVESAKNRITFAFMEDMNNNASKCRFLGFYETVSGNFENGMAYYKRIQQVTPAEVQAVAKRYFDPKNRTVITGVPK